MLGTKLTGRYHIVRHLGGVGFSQTYLAEDQSRKGNPQCIIKRLKPNFVDQKTVRLFEREAQVLRKLGNHEQIPQLLAYFQENQEFYLVQKFIEGNDLNHEIKSGRRLNKLEQYKEALAACDRAVHLQQHYPEAWNHPGIALNHLGRYEEALTAFDQAIEIKLDDPEAWTDRGIALNHLGRYEEALASFDQALMLKPDLQPAIANRQIAQSKLGKVGILSWLGRI